MLSTNLFKSETDFISDFCTSIIISLILNRLAKGLLLEISVITTPSGFFI